jgi:hypothetical protein
MRIAEINRADKYGKQARRPARRRRLCDGLIATVLIASAVLLAID